MRPPWEVGSGSERERERAAAGEARRAAKAAEAEARAAWEAELQRRYAVTWIKDDLYYNDSLALRRAMDFYHGLDETPPPSDGLGRLGGLMLDDDIPGIDVDGLGLEDDEPDDISDGLDDEGPDA